MKTRALRLLGARDVCVMDVERSVPDAFLGVQVEFAGVCGSDLHVYRTGEFVSSFPVTPGHEVVGLVVSPADGFREGDRVVADSRVPCGTCSQCSAGAAQRCPDLGFLGEVSDGGFAEHLAIRPSRVFRVPAGLSSRVAVLAEPTAVVLHARKRAQSAAERSEVVTVLGAGPIGALQALVLADATDLVLVEPDPTRRALVAALTGREVVADGSELRRADVVFDCAGFPGSLQGALALVRPGGVVIAVALHHGHEAIDANGLVAAEATIVGSHVFADEMADALALLATQPERFAGVVTDSVSLDELPRALDAAAEGRHRGLKIIVDPERRGA